MKSITIGDIDVPMLANAATSMVHQRIFSGEDIIVEYNRLFGGNNIDMEDMDLNGKALTLIKHMAFTMAMQAKYLGKEEKLMGLTEIDFFKWLGQFESPFALEEVSDQVMVIYGGDDAATAEEKKESGPQTES